MIVMICHNRATVTHCSSEKRCTGAFTPALPPASMSSPLNIIIIISMSTPCIVIKGFSLYCIVSLFVQIFPLFFAVSLFQRCTLTQTTFITQTKEILFHMLAFVVFKLRKLLNGQKTDKYKKRPSPILERPIHGVARLFSPSKPMNLQ